MAPARISFAGPAKLEAELTQAMAAGVCVNIESEREIDNAGAHRRSVLGIAPRVVLRVNPGLRTASSSGMKMGGGAKQFGIDAEQVPAVLALAAALGRRFLRFPHLQRLAKPEGRRHHRSPVAQHGTGPAAGRRCARAGAPAEYRRRLRHSVFPGRTALDLGADRRAPGAAGCRAWRRRCRRRAWRSSWAATWWAKRACTWRA